MSIANEEELSSTIMTSFPSNRKVLVIAPHPDDEVFGCGGTLSLLHDSGSIVKTIIVTNGAQSGGNADDRLVETRAEESRSAAKMLGLDAPIFWGLPDRGIEYGEVLVGRLSEIILETVADLVFLPSPTEWHPDHQAIAFAGAEALRRLGGMRQVAFYEISAPLPSPNLIYDISPAEEKKRQAMRCFHSQLQDQPYDTRISGINNFRAYHLGAQVTSAEAFTLLSSSELDKGLSTLLDGPLAYRRKLGFATAGSDIPLVSVIIRSMDRPTLSDALDSIATQSYSNIEVVLVNAKGSEHKKMEQWCGRYPLHFIDSGSPLRRSRAANVGLDAAHGEYLMFLDDDDWIEVGHVEKLVTAIEKTPRVKVVYSGVKSVDENKNPLPDKFLFKFDAIRLLAGNFIPIHAILFSRTLLELGCRIDESLEMFEDWDFWLQISQFTDFLFVDGISAIYRVDRQSESGVHLDNPKRDIATLAVFRKWHEGLSDVQIIKIMQAVRHNQEKDVQISNLQQAVSERDTQITNLDGQIANLDGQIANLDGQIANLDGQIANLNQSMINRDEVIKELLASNSWQLTRPLRWCATQMRRAKLLLKAVSLSNAYTGSPKTSFIKLVRVYKREGLAGIRLRVKFLLEKNSFQPANSRHASPRKKQPLLTKRSKKVVCHQQQVDVIICIHNALDDVRRCLDSVMCNTYPPYHLILVDDGSGQETKDYLEKFIVGQPATLIRNDMATGYTKAANTGLRASNGDFVVLLNSDTIVPPQWLDRLIECANSSTLVGMAGPLSNTASWQSVPQLLNGTGDWSDNPLPAGWSVRDFANEIARVSPRIYPRVGFLNGFCLLIKRKLIEDVGLFDEDIFAKGYGEENDYCLRATQKNWQLAVADDCYVYHAQSKSYSHERRVELARLAGEALTNKHGGARIAQNLYLTQAHPALHYMRRRCAKIEEFSILRANAQKRFEGRRVLFLLPAENAGGGGNIVLLEAAWMRSFGVDVWIANLEIHRPLFEQSYPDLQVPVTYLQTPADLPKVASGFDAIIATLYLTVYWMEPLQQLDKCPVLGYYVQDFEPDFFQANSANYNIAQASYTAIGDLRLFTKTNWNLLALQNKLGVSASVVGASFDIDRFHPSPDSHIPNESVHVMAMVRPSTPRRAPATTMRVLERLARHFGTRIQITIFGVDPASLEFQTYSKNFSYINLGEIDPPEVAAALKNADIFVDCSVFQAMGLTAMEAMASGVAVVGPVNGGLNEIIVNGHNGVLVDTRDEDCIVAAVSQLVTDNELRAGIQRNALDVLTHSPVTTSFKILDCLFPQKNQATDKLCAQEHA